MTQVSDDMLMAYADGELDATTAADIRRAIAADPALGRRAAAFTNTRLVVRDAFGDVLHEPVPETLVATVLRGETRENVIAFPPRGGVLTRLALAASLALAAGLGGYALHPLLAPEAVSPEIVALRHLATAPSGEPRLDGGTVFTALSTVRIDGGYCRIFDLRNTNASWRGVGCSQSGTWRVDLLAATAPETDFSAASDSAIASIDSYLDALGASPPLDAGEEWQLLAPR